MKHCILTLGMVGFLWTGGAACWAEEPWDTIEKSLGLKGAMQPGDVYKISLPRTDITVKRGDVTLAPALALTSWMAFKAADGGAVFTHGDLCLLEQEVNPVMSELMLGGIEATALHNHISGEDPRVMFMHFWGRGEAKSLAETLRNALARAGGPQAPPKPLADRIDQATLEKIMGQAGKLNVGVLQFAFPRPFPIRMHGIVLPPSMGMATAINFEPVGAKVVATGDFVLREGELRPLLETLRANNVEVTAIHNHMLDDEPRMVFVHFWGEGDPATLARAMRAGLDKLAASVEARPAADPRWDFEDTAVNTLPAYLDAPRGRWVIQEFPDAPAGKKALVQVAKSPNPYFNLAVLKGERARDLKLSVKFESLSGTHDQGGGLVWRYQDPDNYYIARANPLENNLRLYRVVAGKRQMIESAEVSVSAHEWHTLIVTMREDAIRCELDGKKYFDVRDDTLKNAGQVGVWSKADANTAFDDLLLESFDAPGGSHEPGH